MWGEPVPRTATSVTFQISTHSPRVGRTLKLIYPFMGMSNFNSLAPCGANHIVCQNTFRVFPISTYSPRVGRTSISQYVVICQQKFQLTRPVRGEPQRSASRHLSRQISTHSPRAGRTRHRPGVDTRHPDFNSLAPCGANPTETCLSNVPMQFQLTRPVRGEPTSWSRYKATSRISTHSPRAGRTGANKKQRLVG